MGTLARPHGIKGEICIDWYADSPLLLTTPLWIQAGDAAPRPVRPLAVQKVSGSAGHMEHQLFFAEQVCPAGRKKGRGDMPLLVGRLNQRNAFGRAERCGRTDARQKAWHIGAIHRAGPGGYADSFDLRQVHLLAQFCQHFR